MKMNAVTITCLLLAAILSPCDAMAHGPGRDHAVNGIPRTEEWHSRYHGYPYDHDYHHGSDHHPRLPHQQQQQKHPDANKAVEGDGTDGEPYGCKMVTPCMCQTQDREVMDLSPLDKHDGSPRFKDVEDPSGKFQYSWNPCSSFSEGDCHDVAVCQHIPGYEVPYIGLGNQSSVDFEVSSQHGLMLQYIGQGGAKVATRTTYVLLRCDENTEADFKSFGEPVANSGVYYFELTSRHACLRGGNSTPPTPPTPASPGVVTATSHTPTSSPVYSLKTVVDLLFVLTIVAVVGLVVMVMVLVVVCVKRAMTATTPTAKPAKGYISMSPQFGYAT